MILVLGANGQLGFELKRLLGDQAIYLDRSQCDLSIKADILEIFEKYKFSVLINAAAYTLVDKAEEERERALEINANAPGYLAELCAENEVKFLHYSTDYVFDGNSTHPYEEDHIISPINFYGETKALGEKKVLEANPQALIIRTSWVYSIHGNNFVKTMLKLGNDREEIKVVSDQFGSPTWAHELAKISLLGIEKDMKGIYHYSQEGECSWYDFALEIKRLTGFKARIVPIPSLEYQTKAQRPKYSLLSKNKIKRDFGIKIPQWQESLEQMVR